MGMRWYLPWKTMKEMDLMENGGIQEFSCGKLKSDIFIIQVRCQIDRKNTLDFTEVIRARNINSGHVDTMTTFQLLG